MINQLKHDALKKAFLQTMDNDKGNDWSANAQIAHLASTMSDTQINAAYADAHKHATKKNSKKNGLFDRKDPYKNLNSVDSKMSHMQALQSNDWMNAWPFVPSPIWNIFGGFGCF